MMSAAAAQPSLFYQITLEQFVAVDHPMRQIRPLIETARIRELTGNLVLGWFVGLDLDQQPWDYPRFRRTGSGS